VTGRTGCLVLLLIPMMMSGCGDSPRAAALGPLEERVVNELGALRSGGSAADWLRAHPADSFVPFAPGRVTENLRSWCARASARDTLPGREPVVRRAYFYPPEPSSSLELPPDAAGPDLVRRDCRLGAIWIESPVADTSDRSAKAEALREALGRIFGPVRAGQGALTGGVLNKLQKRAATRLGLEHLQLGVSFFGSAGWRTIGRWEADSITVVSAFDAGLGPTQPRRVLAMAYFPHSNFTSPLHEIRVDTEEEERSPDTSVSTAARLAGIEAPITTAVLGGALPGAQTSDSVRLATLRRWLAAAQRLDSARQAAARFVADAAAPRGFERKDSAALGPYRTLGFEFVYSELDGGYNYTHNMLDQALRLDPGGPIGEMIRLRELGAGFNLNGMCGGGGEAFRKVTRDGEALLSGAKDPKLQAELHFLIGDGYADIVALAAGEGDEYADTVAYLPEATEARRKAIDHYRAGLSIDHGSPKARASWLEAWRLIAGLPPTTTHFFCVYD